MSRSFVTKVVPPPPSAAHSWSASGVFRVRIGPGRRYLAMAEAGGWSSVDAYGRAFTLRHLCLSGDQELLGKAADLLENLDFLQATI